MKKKLYISMLKRRLNIFIIAITILFLGISLYSHAAEVFYFYDDIGRLNKAVTDTGDVAIYSYDEVGNLLSISRQTTNPAPPVITGISPDIIFAGTTVPITITGNNLIGTTDVSADAPGVSVSGVTVTNTAITATLNISRDATTGSANIKVSTVFGTASIAITVMKLTITPTIKTALPGDATDFRLDISQNAPKNINISLISEDTSIMQVPASMTFAAGQNTLSFTASALTEGTTVIKVANGAAFASVYVTQPFTGEASSITSVVSVLVEPQQQEPQIFDKGPFLTIPVSILLSTEPQTTTLDKGPFLTVPVSVIVSSPPQTTIIDNGPFLSNSISVDIEIQTNSTSSEIGPILSAPVSMQK